MREVFDSLRDNPGRDPGRVEVDSERGGYRVAFSDGTEVPAVEQYRDGRIRCPGNCEDETHRHEVTGDPVSFHARHGRRYAVLRPRTGLLGTAFRWWRSRGRGPLAFTSKGE